MFLHQRKFSQSDFYSLLQSYDAASYAEALWGKNAAHSKPCFSSVYIGGPIIDKSPASPVSVSSSPTTSSCSSLTCPSSSAPTPRSYNRSFDECSVSSQDSSLPQSLFKDFTEWFHHTQNEDESLDSLNSTANTSLILPQELVFSRDDEWNSVTDIRCPKSAFISMRLELSEVDNFTNLSLGNASRSSSDERVSEFYLPSLLESRRSSIDDGAMVRQGIFTRLAKFPLIRHEKPTSDANHVLLSITLCVGCIIIFVMLF